MCNEAIGYGFHVVKSLRLYDPHPEADAFLEATDEQREVIRRAAEERLARLVQDRATQAVGVAASYHKRKARQSRELRARRAVASGRKPGRTGRPRKRTR
jgi:hypothetical protein